MTGLRLVAVSSLAGAALALALAASAGRDAPAPAVDAADGTFAPATPIARAPPPSPLEAAWERPLFSRDRRPASPEAPPSLPVPAQPGAEPEPVRDAQISLLGVFQAGPRSSALLASNSGDAPRWVALGEAFAGVTLVAIHSDRVALRADGHVRSVLLRRAAFPE